MQSGIVKSTADRAADALPSQTDLFSPVLEAIRDAGNRARTASLYDQVAERVRLSRDARERRRTCKGHQRGYRRFEQSVRWVIQRAKAKGYLRSPKFGEWELTGKGKEALSRPRAGRVFAVFVCQDGLALWGCAADAMGLIDDGSIQLALSSPPYPLLREKAYGNQPVAAYNDWLCRILERVLPKLTSDGSLVLNIGDAWNPGEPTVSTFAERLIIQLEDRLGLRLCQRFEWHNPSKLPAPAEWVTRRRERVKPSVERIWWLSPTAHPKSRQRAVLQPYSDSMKARLASGGEPRSRRPSGHTFSQGAFSAENGGAIPPSLIEAANTESNSAYIRGCKRAGLPIHPARFPAALPAFFIKLTTDEGDPVLDFFGGSGMTAAEARRLGRPWVLVDQVLEYLRGAAIRLEVPASHQMPLLT